MTEHIGFIGLGNIGLGEAIALTFAAEGSKFVLCARYQDELDKVATDVRHHSGDVLAIAANLTKADDINRLLAETITHFSTI